MIRRNLRKSVTNPMRLFGSAGFVFALLATATSIIFANSVGAKEKRETRLPWLDNEYYYLSLNVRARIELADIDGFKDAEAYTIRPRIGLGTRPLYGFSTFIEGEGIFALERDSYFDGASVNTKGKSVIADPEKIELNQLWLQLSTPELRDASIKAGRQRIIHDNARLLGNVGWRQNEQTYDAVRTRSKLPFNGLTAEYVYLWDIRRIFGDQGPTRATRDFESDSHAIRIHYEGIEKLALTAFAYLLDFGNDSPGNSSNSFGFRAAGSIGTGTDAEIRYATSYAYQTEAEANPTHYRAHYFWANVGLLLESFGTVGLGYELLGSDDGTARFVTPLATAHKFNGFADAFLDNGGGNGLQNLIITIAPELPWSMEGEMNYHEFWSHERGNHLGREIDAVLSRNVTPNLTALSKFAWFDGDSKGPADRWRLWFQLTFNY